MIRLENMLMIGSSGSNAGKTELACALLRRFHRNHRIIGVKVTTVAARDGSCPRGGQGCGVCSSLEGMYSITQESGHDRTPMRSPDAQRTSGPGAGKDTAKLLAAGAEAVYWLRVLRTHLQEGWAALSGTIDREAVVICESNSLRQIVEPGLFLMVENREHASWKSSAQQVRRHADCIVHSDGSRFDLDLERVRLAGTRWVLTEDAAAIVLAGGRSRRMGTDKSLLAIQDRPMIEHICRQLGPTFTRVFISANDPAKFSFLGLEVVPDRIPDQGPLMAVASALEASDRELNLIVSCDIPQVNLVVVRRMLAEAQEADVVIPVTQDGKEQPLFAVYRRSARGCMEEVLASGGRRLRDIYGRCRVRFVELDDTGWFVNLNTNDDYERFRRSTEACASQAEADCDDAGRKG
jgi:molybdenum cofactor guanylyltransferase